MANSLASSVASKPKTHYLLQTASVRGLIVGALIAATPHTASAQTATVWDGSDTVGDGRTNGGSGTWTVNGSNWTNSNGTTNGRYDPNAILIFGGSGGTVTVDNSGGVVTVRRRLQFESDGYRIAGGPLDFTGANDGGNNFTIQVGNGTAAGAAITAAIASNFTSLPTNAGAGGLRKIDLGTLVLTGTGSFNREIAVEGGTLRIEGGAQITSSGALLGDGQVAVSQVPRLVVSGSGTVLNIGSGPLTTSPNVRGFTQPTAIDILNGGTLRDARRVGHSIGVGTLVTVSGPGSLLDLSTPTSMQGDLLVEKGAIARIAPMQMLGQRRTFIVREGGKVETLAGDQNWTFTDSRSVLIQGQGSSFTSVVPLGMNVGTNFVVEDRASVTVNAGGSSIGSNDSTSTIDVRSGASFNLNPEGSVFGPVFSMRNTQLRVTDATFANTGSISTDGATGSTISLKNANFSARDVILLGARDRLLLGGDVGEAAGAVGRFDVSSIRLQQPSSSMVFNYTGPGLTIGADFGGEGTIRHLAGNTRFTGNANGNANQWRGVTLLSGGSLAVDGGFFGDGTGPLTAMTVSGGATLSGRGSIGGTVTVSDGTIRPGGDALNATGTLLGGNAVGNLTFSGNLALGAATRLAYQLGAPTGAAGVASDLITVGGNLTLDGTLDVASTGAFGAGLYRLIDYSGTLTNNILNIGAAPTGFAASDLSVQTSVARQVNLLVGTPAAPAIFNFWDGANSASNNLVDGGTGTWTAAGGNWTLATGATNGAYDPAQLLIFSGAAGTVTVNNTPAPIPVAVGMQFATNGYTLTGGALQLTTPTSALVTGSTIRVGDGTAAGAAITANIATALTGPSGMDKTDLGTLRLTGANTYVGETRVLAGNLAVAGGTLGGTAATSALRVAAPGTTATVAVSGGAVLTSTAASVGIETGGNGTVTVAGAGSRWNIVGTGAVRIGNASSPNTRGLVEVLDGGVLNYGAGLFSVAQGSTVRVSGANSRLDATGTLLFNQGSGGGNLLLENGGVARAPTFEFGSTSALTVRSGARLETTSTASLDFNVGAQALVTGTGTRINSAGALSIGSGNFVIDDNAIVTATANTDSGFGNSSGLTPDSTRQIIVRNGAQLNLTGGTGAGMLLGSTLLVQNASVTMTGNLLLGQRVAGNAVTLLNSNLTALSLTAFTGNSVNLGGTRTGPAGAVGIFAVPDVTLINTGELNFNHTSNRHVLDSRFASGGGSGGQINVIAGNTVFTGDSAGFVGNTLVSGGSLIVNGRLASGTLSLAGETSVTAGATIGGTGTLGNLRVTGGTIAPGDNGVGTLTMTGNLFLDAASRLAFQLGAPNTPGVGSDLINVSGNLTLDGTVDITNAGGFGAGLYRLINYGGALTNNVLNIGAVPGGFSATDLTVQTSVAQQVNLIVGAPPPAFTSFSFWDGANTTANRAVDGGTGTWTTTARNWTVSTGEANGVYDPTQLLIFAGTGGVATVDTTPGAVVIGRGLQFAVNGYRVEGGALTLGTNAITLRVGDGTAAGAAISATIASNLIGGASIEKTDLGTLILTGSAAPTAGTMITTGTLQIGAGGATGSIGGNVANNGALVFNRAGTLAYAGVVSGSGTLEQRGPGTLTLSGVHSYTGLTIVSAGTLANTGTIVGATNVLAAGTLTNAGTLAAVTNAGTGTNTGTMGALNNTAGSFTNDGTLNGAVVNNAGATFATTATLNGSLTNNGTARIGGVVNGALDNRAGTVTATAATTGIGALTQTTGATLNLAGFALTAGSLAGDGAVQLGAGTLTSGGSNASTAYAGVVSGTGRLVKTGTGQLTLTGANSYSGGTSVTAGTLAGNSASLQGAIVNDGRVRFDQVTAGTYAGALSGTGQLEKAGTGRLDLTGTSVMSGGTLVSGGELAVNGSLARSIVTVGSGARLGGSGIIGGVIAQSGSTVAPGNSVGTLTVQGNVVLAAGSTFAVEVQGASADRITATGTAQLAGILAVIAAGGPYTFATPYVLLSAAGGRTGTFDSVTGLTDFGPGIRPTVSYDATTVTLRLDPNALGPLLAGVALTPNQRSAQTRFDAAIAAGSTNPAPFFPIFNLPLNQLPTALDALSGEVHATAARLALDDERMVRKSTLDQLRGTADVTGTTAWGAAFGTFGRIASDGNAARVTRDTGGFITGIDTGGALAGADSGWRIGAQVHHLRTTFAIIDRASSGSLSRTGGGIHAALKFGGLSIRAGATLASVKVKTTRSIAASGFSEQGTAAKTGTAFQAFGEIGYSIGDNRASLEPFAGLSHARLRLGDVAEIGGVSSVTVKAQHYTLTLADFGLRGQLRLTPSNRAAISLKGTLGLRQVIGGQALASNIGFASAPTLNFAIATVAQDKSSFVPEIGFDADLGGGTTFNLTYSGVIGKRAQDHGVKAGIRIAF